MESLGITGANAPMPKLKFVEFLLARLEQDPACSFEVRENAKVPTDPVRVSDSRILKKLLQREEEEGERAKQMLGRQRSMSTWRGGSRSQHNLLKTEFVTKSWEEVRGGDSDARSEATS